MAKGTTGVGSFRAGLVQTCTGRNVSANLHAVSALVREARDQGAEYIQTPEVTVLMETDPDRLAANVGPQEGNRAVAHFSELAAELGCWLHIGSMAVATDEPRLANRSFMFDPNGRIAATYDKIHMFDVDISDADTYAESRRYAPGRRSVLVDLPWAVFGLTICYDMRFPALYRALAKAGAEVITVPSAFTVPTGQAHWHALLRARAIESQCFVLAAAQAGTHESGRLTYGHSIAISPWGEVLAEADGTGTGVITVDIDLAAVADARRRVPSLHNDQPFDIVRANPI